MLGDVGTVTAASIISQLKQARDLAFSSKEMFPQVLRQILQFANNPELQIQRWCALFLKESFESDDSKLDLSVKVDLAIDALDSLITLCNIPDSEIFKNCIDTSIVVFRLVFRYVAENDGCPEVWAKLTELKTIFTSKFSTCYPYPPSEDEEKDWFRGLDVQIELLKFIILVIDYQTKSAPNIASFSLSQVPPRHSLIKKNMEAEAYGLLDNVLQVLANDVLVTPLITAILFHFAIIVKKKPQFTPKILKIVERLDTNLKLQSNYESVEQFKLSRKYVDRSIKIFLNHVLRNQLVPSNLNSALSKRLTQLVSRGDDIRKKNILAPSPEDTKITKRKFEGFINPSKKIKTNDYKSLYCLIEPNNELSNFDLSTLPQNILVSMTLTALAKAPTGKLVKALDIVKDRMDYVSRNFSPVPQVKKVDEGEDDDDENTNDIYSPEINYTLPPPKELTYAEKKEHINLVVTNFFKLSEIEVDNSEGKQELNETQDNVSKELTRIAIKAWKKDSWLVLLTRLATRGMRSIESGSLATNGSRPNSDAIENEAMSNIVRQAIFDHFLDNVHGRIDMVIEWLNEEWYSEKVFNEELIRDQLTEKYTKEYEENATEVGNIDERVSSELEQREIPTPTYINWTAKVLDSLIPFLEPNDRKIFIRLLSDLPYLDSELVSRIKSLCYDPGRIKIGFLSLQFLIMYRPPVRLACISILEELSQSDQEDLKEEAKKLLTKYKN